MDPAGIIGLFEEEEKQREVAALFHAKLESLEDRKEREKAFHDILVSVKTYSYQYYADRLGSDMSALKQMIDGKKALEELKNTHISFE